MTQRKPIIHPQRVLDLLIEETQRMIDNNIDGDTNINRARQGSIDNAFPWGNSRQRSEVRSEAEKGNYTLLQERVDKQTPTFTRGEEVEVSSYGVNREPRIYLATIEGATYEHISVSMGYDDEFKKGDKFDTSYRKHIRKIPQIKELTHEQVEKELGYKFKII